jgi:HlyD family secretion protein
MHTLERPATNGHVSSVNLTPARRRPRWLIVGIALLCVLAIVASIIVVRDRAGAVTYTTVPVQIGSLAQTVTASGTLNPQNTIDIGTQVSGTISEIDADFNSHVRKGQILAKIDPTTFQAALDQAKATLAQSEAQAQASGATAGGGNAAIAAAQAQVAAANAGTNAAKRTAAAAQAAVATARTTVTRDQAALVLAQQTVTRDAALIKQGYIAQSQLDTDQSNLVAAQTTLSGAQASVAQAQAQADAAVAQIATANATAQEQLAQTGVTGATAANQIATHAASVAAIAIQQAQVTQAQQNVEHTVITSPVDGTVIARDVSIGQTVAASLQTPTLFAIAQDLTRMELDLAVGEPDIGHVAAGDPVSFSVLAYPNRTFTGTISQVRKNPTTVSNVVTYTVVVIVSNKDNALLPGMTANATISVAHVDNAVIVPLTALGYTPAAGTIAHRNRSAASGANAATSAKSGTSANATPAGASSAAPWGATTSASTGAVTSGSTGRVFVQRDGKLTPVRVSVGIVGDTQATVTPLQGTLAAGDAVVVSDSRGSAAHSSSGSASTRSLLSGTTGGPGGAGGRGGAPR